MGRPADNPTPFWSDEHGCWCVRVTKPRPPHLKPGQPSPRTLVRLVTDRVTIERHDRERAERFAKLVVKQVRAGQTMPEEDGETVADWSDRWLADRKARGISSADDDAGRLRKHILPVIGGRPIAQVTREDIERVVEALDAKILSEGDDHIEWKTASNTWMVVSKMMDDAAHAKKRDLRTRTDNPAKGVRGPETGDRKAKQYLYPSELLQLVSAPDDVVPLRHRTLYAVAVYTYMRAGELEALLWSDVDLVHGVIQVTKAVDRKTGEVKSTKSGETRRIPIEPNLLPLLRRLHATKTGDAVVWMQKDDERAAVLRGHLLAAGVDRPDLHTNDDQRRHLTFHDLRATGITWAAVRGDDPLRIRQRAGHSGFATTEGYIREAENLADGFGIPFPRLPAALTGGTGGECREMAEIAVDPTPLPDDEPAPFPPFPLAMGDKSARFAQGSIPVSST